MKYDFMAARNCPTAHLSRFEDPFFCCNQGGLGKKVFFGGCTVHELRIGHMALAIDLDLYLYYDWSGQAHGA